MQTNSISSDFVSIIEVGPRDGLQNEPSIVTLSDKISLIERLADAGLKHIEAGSFVSPKWVPQMADSLAVFEGIQRQSNVIYSALIPNMKGFESALSAQADEVAIFTAASESFTQKNINCSIAESINRFIPLIEMAKYKKIRVRAYVSCILSCPYEGKISHNKVIEVTQRLLELGCYEVSLGDTIGIGRPHETKALLQGMLKEFSSKQLALHFHDTYGQAIANQYVALELGFRRFDSSLAGLGGCPYAKGASGNVSTEDLVYMLEGAGMNTGINLDKLILAGHLICYSLNRNNHSKVANARGFHPEGELC
ncbi:MAG: hydroxymethylglutaryl-CoA lyase [Oleiphilaceae bacterium]|jgi:hydroxymethylglutaryl-CoA lyase